jgi:trans-2,3-dihydro-3-hydroxyanthranilate isomerase
MDNPSGTKVLPYFIVDVFTEQALQGNPLAVVMNTCGLTTEQMQAIAVEFNLSETTFVERRSPDTERREGVRVRIFTTQEELQFAGHPTLGTASVLKLTAPETVHDGLVTLAENVGPIPVRFESGEKADSLFAEMTQREPEFGPELDRAKVAAFCGLVGEDLDPEAAPQVVSTGAGFAIVLLKSVEALGRLRVEQEGSGPWLRGQGARWFYVLARDGDGFRARMQFNGGEDPATGSAAGCAVSYLVKRGVAPSGKRFPIRQGIEMGRPSNLFVSAQREDIRVVNVCVAGSTVLVAKGALFLP